MLQWPATFTNTPDAENPKNGHPGNNLTSQSINMITTFRKYCTHGGTVWDSPVRTIRNVQTS